MLDLGWVREHMAEHYSLAGRPSICPELMIRMLLVGYLYGIRPERRLCEEVGLNLAFRWFCHLGLDGCVPDHSTFTKNRHGRFRESDLMRKVFERIVQQCPAAGLASAEHVAVDGSNVQASADYHRRVATKGEVPREAASRAARDALAGGRLRRLRQAPDNQRATHGGSQSALTSIALSPQAQQSTSPTASIV